MQLSGNGERRYCHCPYLWDKMSSFLPQGLIVCVNLNGIQGA